MAIQKPTAHCADEILQGNWPEFNEDDAVKAADFEMKTANHIESDTIPAFQGGKNQIASDMEGQTAEAALAKMGIHIGEAQDKAASHANASGWFTAAAGYITTAKTAMASAVEAHEAIHMLPTKQVPNMPSPTTQSAKDASMNSARAEVTNAKAALDAGMKMLKAGLAANTAPPGGTPKIKDPSGGAGTSERWSSGGGLPSDFPSAPQAGQGAGAGGGGPQQGLAAPGAPSGTPAPTAPAAPATPPAAELGAPSPSAGAGMGNPAAQGAGNPMGGANPMGMGGAPMGMQQPQMPQAPQMGGGGGQTPGNDVAKTIGDTVGKLTQNQQGQPISKAALDDLLGRQDASGEGVKPEHGGGANDGTTQSDRGEKKGTEPKGVHTTLQGPTLDPYSSANTNPALNNPAAPHLAGPSPAAPTVTPSPLVTAGAPITQLSADESGGTATPVSHQQPATSTVNDAHAVTHSSNSTQGVPGAASTLPPNPGPAQQQPLLGAYPPAGGGFGPMPGPAAGAVGIGGAGVGAAAASIPAVAATAAGAPVLGVTPVAKHDNETREARSDNSPRHVDRLAGLPAEYLRAEMQLATLLSSFTQAGWAGTILAVGVFLSEDSSGTRLRYLAATADGLSILPSGIAVPAGVELLSGQPDIDLPFFWKWAGSWHAGHKLAAYAQNTPAAGQLVYLVSNDNRAGAPTATIDGYVSESVQTDTERARLAESGRILPTTLSRAELVPPLIPAERAAEAVKDFGEVWGWSGTQCDLEEATSRLWAARWDEHRARDSEYPAILATYLFDEARDALRQSKTLDAAYSIDTAMFIEPQRVSA